MSSNPRLGRGLAALLGDRPDAAVHTDGVPPPIRNLPVGNLTPGPFQPRTHFSAETLAELVDSIRAQGILQPLLARPHPQNAGQYQIIAGERRWRAAQQAGLHEVPVLLRDLSDADSMAASLVENLQRQDLNPIEEAEGFRRLAEEFSLSQEQLGAAVGKSRSHVANILRLLNLPPSVREHVQSGALTAGHARALLSHPDPEAASRLVLSRGLNVRQTEALSSVRPAPTAQPAELAVDPEIEALQRDLAERLGVAVTVAFDGKGGVLSLKYKSLDQLDGLLALLSA